MIPLLHDFEGETVLVFGGGPVGARKARRFAREARVVVVSPDFDDHDFGTADRVRAAPTPEEVPGWFDRTQPALAVAATDDVAVNARVEREARDRGLLVNRADTHGERDPGSVIVPATVRDGDVVVAVSTGGTAPALSKYLRERLTQDVENAGAMADLLGDVREDLQARGVDPNRRRAAVRTIVNSSEVWKHLDTRRSKARQAAESIVTEELNHD